MGNSLLLIANADAGSADADAVERARRVLESSCDVEYRQTSTASEIDQVVNDLSDRTLVVAGGDGSLHAAVNAMHRTSTLGLAPVGLIPLGTGNDLARTAQIPLDPVAAAEIVINGHACDHDLLVGSDGVVAVNAVHLGIGAEAVRLGVGPKRLLGSLGYPVAAAFAGVRYPGWQLDVVVDGRPEPRAGRVLMVGISLGRTIGGGAPLAPAADVGDGLADVTIASTTGMVRRARFAARLRRGEHDEMRDVRTSRGSTIEVAGDEVRSNTDGEVSGPRRRWKWTVAPRAWQLIHPPADN